MSSFIDKSIFRDGEKWVKYSEYKSDMQKEESH